LHDFKHGVRVEEDMAKVAQKMSEQDMADVGAWYASLERPPMQGGEPLLLVKVCDSCHNEEIVEQDNHIEVAPVITGQVRKYLENSIRAFKQMERSNDLFQRMRSESHALEERDIVALAKYYGAAEE
jgi:cytochrome c553